MSNFSRIKVFPETDLTITLGFNNDNSQTNGEYNLLHKLLSRGNVVFDVGANIGEWTQYCHSINDNLLIYSFEPQKDQFKKLCATVGCYAKCNNYALSSIASKRNLYSYNISTLSSFHRRSEAVEKSVGVTAHTVEVETITLDVFCSDNNIEKIDFLKIDTEGHELDVLNGASRLLENQAIKFIQFEYGGCYPDAGITLEQVFKLLQSNGYTIFRIIQDGIIHVKQWYNELENFKYANYLAVHPDEILQKNAPLKSKKQTSSPTHNFNKQLKTFLQIKGQETQSLAWLNYQEDFLSYFSLFEKSNELAQFNNIIFYPCLEDKMSSTPVDKYYFYQDTWAAKKIFERKPERVVDIGSTVLYAGIISQFVPTYFVDIRPVTFDLPNFFAVDGSVLDLPFEDASQPFITSLCVLEHIGLGRYGDPIMPDGTQKACVEIDRVLQPNGELILSVNLGIAPCIAFNAHRIFSKDQFLSYFPNYTILDEIYLSPEPTHNPAIINTLDIGEFVVWVVHLQKNKQNVPCDTSHFIYDFLQMGDMVFDVGANMGNKIDDFLKYGVKVIAVEPQPDCVQHLITKYKSNRLVTVVPNGLSNQAGTMALHICSSANTITTFSQEWQHGRFSNYKWDKIVNVEVTTLDVLIEKYGRPKYCKIDVEGFEEQVLRGLSYPIPYISFEFAIEFFSNTLNCLSILESIGYVEFNFALGEESRFYFNNWVSKKILTESIEHFSDPLLWGDIYVKYTQ